MDIEERKTRRGSSSIPVDHPLRVSSQRYLSGCRTRVAQGGGSKKRKSMVFSSKDRRATTLKDKLSDQRQYCV